MYLRRNSTYYTFISYINNSIGCYISDNFDGTSRFICRAYKEFRLLEDRNEIKDENIEYFSLCKKYLITISENLIQKQFVSEFENKELISLGLETLLN
ncbi:hypothetical protein GCM10007380_09050 [Gottfriedia solisilvae]|uniref:Uncharacterized protein n=1 Tax=Gottfriedia solisilvae TaxID=1516104 RepID=A0A8J3EX79_9BACI|nr:hypothetical protein GCM10007380_09050 [Gottfriedia solisilvae]